MTIYTKKGDKGETALFNSKTSQRMLVAKDSLEIDAIGAIDEVNSYLGTISFNEEPGLKKIIEKLQGELFTIGSILAGTNLRFYSTKAKYLEKQIDEMQRRLPVIKHFILPGGTFMGSQLHFARALTRRAERAVVTLNNKEEIKPQILIYLNRLSDFFFVLARMTNHNHGAKEKYWQGAK
ncbi:cob(I)yrinic acid a,c-diamide adenosyltransferase [Candidatus Woesebacteria bacterium]|nr:MAG: cob(I)yrinic acid a,c-diamide adenosyltransferase [Candidatus Woesebacteria bacterium]